MNAQDAAPPVPDEHDGGRRRGSRSADSFAGGVRLRKRTCVNCRRRFRPVTPDMARCGACQARLLARGEFMRALRIAGALPK